MSRFVSYFRYYFENYVGYITAVDDVSGTASAIKIQSYNSSLEGGLSGDASANLKVGNAITLSAYYNRDPGVIPTNSVASRGIYPWIDNTYELGNANYRWSLIRGTTITPGDAVGEAFKGVVKSDSQWAASAQSAIAVIADALINRVVKEGVDYVAGYEQRQQERERIGRSLGSFKAQEILRKALQFSISEHVRFQNSLGIMASVWSNPAGRYPAWEFVKKNWKEQVAVLKQDVLSTTKKPRLFSFLLIVILITVSDVE